MRRKLLNRFLKRCLIVDTLTCVVAYFLQPISDWFAWIWVAASILLIWLIVASMLALLEFFIYTDDR